MSIIAVLGLVVALAVLIYGSFRSVPTMALSIGATVIIIVCNGLGMWEGLSVWAEAFGNTVTSYIFVFLFSAVFAKFMGITGAASTIGYKIVDWFGTTNVCLVVAVMVGLLCYGGVSLYVVIFVVAPIMFVIFKEANLPRHLIIIPFYMGHCTWSMTCLPGAPSVQNIIPTDYLGTTLMAAPVLGIAMTIFEFVLQMMYWKYAVKVARRKNEYFEFPANFDASRYETRNDKDLPNTVNAFIPIIAPLVIILGAGILNLPISENTTLLMIIAMVVGTILCVVLCGNWMKDGDDTDKISISKKMFNEAGVDAVTGVASIAYLVALGSVISTTPIFDFLVEWVKNGWNMNVYWKAIFGTSLISGITASSTAGIRLMLQNFSDYFIASGCNLEALHRIMITAASSLDTLPHSCTIPLFYGILGCTYKNAYKHQFVISVLITFLAACFGGLICTVFV